MDMVRISAEAVQDIKEVLKERKMDTMYLRINASVGSGGMSYNLVLDEPAKNDKVEEHDGLSFVVEDNLLEMSQGFTVSSFQQEGQTYFKILPEKEAADSSGCSSCPSCG